MRCCFKLVLCSLSIPCKVGAARCDMYWFPSKQGDTSNSICPIRLVFYWQKKLPFYIVDIPDRYQLFTDWYSKTVCVTDPVDGKREVVDIAMTVDHFKNYIMPYLIRRMVKVGE